jgi:L-seryl-tRNA(Ser) seleniumtransferase
MNSSINFKNIPSVNFLLNELISKFPDIQSVYLKQFVLLHLELIRKNPQGFNLKDADKDKFKELILGHLSCEIKKITSGTLKKVINATGVVLHTGLGRAPLNNKIVDTLEDVRRYTNLEINMETGKRGERLDHISSLLKILTGAEDGIACNNNAAAVMLMLNSVAYRKEVLLSRGEMIEIGGSFRLPEVIKSSGCKLLEIGTTNRTHLKDYENAISQKTGAILICHTSNYEIQGFTHHPPVEEIVSLAKKYNLPVLYDLGSGSLLPTSKFVLNKEPEIKEILNKNVDLVSFSGDKLLGGPQSGMIVGKAKWVKKCRKNHLLRALRLDKFIIKLLQQTLIMYFYKTSESIPELDTIKALTCYAGNIKKRCEAFVTRLSKELDAQIKIIKAKGKVGSGAYPTLELESYALQIKPNKMKAELLGKKLRQAKIPIISYITNDQVLIDLRTVSESEEKQIGEALKQILRKS